ncbi:MAG TPA: threonine--tRNA ligase [Blastocatellia bacterium]|jgi:threonyl-tRNA synthetase|nr:threonine--tRNA ligase [Blastocatellia bacterium]
MGDEVHSDQEIALGVKDFPSERDYQMYCLKHSASHVMAAAVQQIFPEAKFGIGPPIKNGFYYDMQLSRPLTPEDLEEIERRMREISKSGFEFHQETWDKQKALEFFGSRDQTFKLELIEGIPGETVSTYMIGDFTDLCAGPHVRRTSQCKHFKLTSIAGAYWRGNEHNPMLQRIYGTVWPTKDELEEYLHNVEEAKRRDHRKVGRELDLFMMHEWAPGATFWLPKGTIIYHTLQEKMRKLLARNGYVEVKGPLIASSELFKTSGHWTHFREDMFIFQDDDERTYAAKPMNCPAQMLIFGSRRRSYRELPLRMSEQSVLHRNERAGSLAGLTRVRQFQQDDAHIFITEDQIGEEFNRLLGLVDRVYKAFGMSYRFVLSTRNEEKFMGDIEVWNAAEAALGAALEANNLEYTIAKGEATFYGPKIDQMVQDSLKREHQLATIQLDFQLPRNFGLSYVNEHNAESVPVVVHRAIYGSLERFIGILIEHYAGAFPVWLAPVQIKVLSISEKAADYARQVYERLIDNDLRVELDVRDDKIGAKIRDAQLEKAPYMLVVGAKEAESGAVAVRSREKGDEGPVPLDEFIARVKGEANFNY